MTWTEVPPPPAPTAINDFPATPPRIQVARLELPNEMVSKEPLGLTISRLSQVLTVYGQWTKLVSGTATVDSPFSQSESYTTGTVTTDSTTKSFSVSLGVSGSLGSIGGSLSESFTHTVSLSESKTVTSTFNISPKSGSVSLIWWQLVHTFEIDFAELVEFGDKKLELQPGHVRLVNRAQEYISTQFPAVSDAQVEVTGG